MPQRSQLTLFKKILLVLCIVIPPLGALGIHDFIVGDEKHGKDHLAMVLLVFFAPFLIMMVMVCDSGCSQPYSILISLLAYLGMALVLFPIISYLWAILECFQILLGRKNDGSVLK
ncbi:hypothetical protein IJI29_02185 [Candidatus Saccharibacteria bacterium]|nr:hypothetical protein [Candidatus Saccharibacteria bacterium]